MLENLESEDVTVDSRDPARIPSFYPNQTHLHFPQEGRPSCRGCERVTKISEGDFESDIGILQGLSRRIDELVAKREEGRRRADLRASRRARKQRRGWA